MRQYGDLPMDLADSSLLWVAQEHGLRRIATLARRDFGIYRLPGGESLENLLNALALCCWLLILEQQAVKIWGASSATGAALGCCTSSWTTLMQVVSFSEARESFKAVLDRVEADADVTLITRRHAQGAVLMSLATYNSLMETVHLLRSPANAAHLQRSLEQADRGECLERALIEPGQAGAGS
jgi:antitoxin YefM